MDFTLARTQRPATLIRHPLAPCSDAVRRATRSARMLHTACDCRCPARLLTSVLHTVVAQTSSAKHMHQYLVTQQGSEGERRHIRSHATVRPPHGYTPLHESGRARSTLLAHKRMRPAAPDGSSWTRYPSSSRLLSHKRT